MKTKPSEMRVLLLVYAFPPRGGVGVMRCLSFARYLPRHDCRVWVVTARNASNAYYDPSLLQQVPAEVAVHRTFTPELPYNWRTWLWERLRRPAAPAASAQPAAGAGAEASRLQRLVGRLATPDPQRVWTPWALARAKRLIRRNHIDTVLISVPPFSELLLAAPLRRAFPSLKLILDFRDEWLDFTMSSIESVRGLHSREAAARVERQAVEAADLVLSVTAAWRDRIRARYAEQPADKFQCLPNGYDDQLLQGFQPRPHQGNKLVITYMGTVYARPVYSPEVFLRALDDLDRETLDSLEVRFVGRVEPRIEALLENRTYQVTRYGFMPQREGLRLCEEADVLLLLAADPAWQPAKLFEYVAMRKPILAIAPPDGEVARLIRETGTGQTVSPQDPEAIRAAVRELVQRRRSGPCEISPMEPTIARYSRSSLAARLAGMIGGL